MVSELQGLSERWFQAWLEKDAASVERLAAEDYICPESKFAAVQWPAWPAGPVRRLAISGRFVPASATV